MTSFGYIIVDSCIISLNLNCILQLKQFYDIATKVNCRKSATTFGDLPDCGWYALFRITNNRHDVAITTHAIKRHFLIWMMTMRQPMKRRCSCVLTLKYTVICVYWWTRQRIHNTLIVVDRYLRLMGDKTIPDSAEPRLESFYPPFVAGIDLPHQGVVDDYNPCHDASKTGPIETFEHAMYM